MQFWLTVLQIKHLFTGETSTSTLFFWKVMTEKDIIARFSMHMSQQTSILQRYAKNLAAKQYSTAASDERIMVNENNFSNGFILIFCILAVYSVSFTYCFGKHFLALSTHRFTCSFLARYGSIPKPNLSLYSPYNAVACNKLRCPSPGHSAKVILLLA